MSTDMYFSLWSYIGYCLLSLNKLRSTKMVIVDWVPMNGILFDESAILPHCMNAVTWVWVVRVA